MQAGTTCLDYWLLEFNDTLYVVHYNYDRVNDILIWTLRRIGFFSDFERDDTQNQGVRSPGREMQYSRDVQQMSLFSRD